MSEKVQLDSATWTYTQDGDSVGNGDVQVFEVEVTDGGGGPFLVIKTERWAIDSPDELILFASEISMRARQLGFEFKS